YAFIFMTIGFFIGYIKKIFFTDGILLPVILISVGDFVYGIYYYATEFLLRGRVHMGFFFIKIILPEMIYTILVGILLFYLINFIDEALLTRRSRREEDF
nr:rod shape-determining protein MreD [Eubacterium sp.]